MEISSEYGHMVEKRLRRLEEIEKEDAIVDHEVRRTLVYEIREREHHLANIEKRIIGRGEELEDLSGSRLYCFLGEKNFLTKFYL